jgi:hypothetical protein
MAVHHVIDFQQAPQVLRNKHARLCPPHLHVYLVQLSNYWTDVGNGKFEVHRKQFVKEEVLMWWGSTRVNESILRKEVHEKIGQRVGGG